MTVINGYAQSLHVTFKGNSQIINTLDEINNLISKCKDITTNILSFAHRKERAMHLVQFNIVIDSSLKLIENSLKSRNVQVVKIYAQDLFPVTGRIEELKQLALNIIINSIEAMGDNAQLTIGTKNEGDNIIVYFEDNGTGISKEDLSKVYDPFFSTKMEGESIGLGLFLCKDIVKAHEGTIKVESQKGSGTTVTVILPAKKLNAS